MPALVCTYVCTQYVVISPEEFHACVRWLVTDANLASVNMFMYISAHDILVGGGYQGVGD